MRRRTHATLIRSTGKEKHKLECNYKDQEHNLERVLAPLDAALITKQDVVLEHNPKDQKHNLEHELKEEEAQP